MIDIGIIFNINLIICFNSFGLVSADMFGSLVWLFSAHPVKRASSHAG